MNSFYNRSYVVILAALHRRTTFLNRWNPVKLVVTVFEDCSQIKLRRYTKLRNFFLWSPGKIYLQKLFVDSPRYAEARFLNITFWMAQLRKGYRTTGSQKRSISDHRMLRIEIEDNDPQLTWLNKPRKTY